MTTKNEVASLPGIDVLNTGYGDFELRFDPDKMDEVQKAKETITDMLKRGYAIFIKDGDETYRVKKFDVNRNVYIIGSTPSEEVVEVPITKAKAVAVGRSAGG
jgi:spore germination protein YaaH